MKVEVKKIDRLKRKIKIEVKGEEFLKEKKQAYQTHFKQLKVPGFRPGSAPLDILEKHHGAFLKEELLKKFLPFFYSQALEQEKITAAGLPDISEVELGEDALSFSAEFEARPEIEIAPDIYQGIKLKDIKIEVEAQEIEKIITNLAESTKKVTGQSLDDEQISRWAAYPNSAALREAIRGQLFVEKMRQRRFKIESQIRSQLLKSLKIELPKSEVEYYHRQLLERELLSLRRQGVSEEELDKYKENLKDKLKPLAEEEIKLSYILEAIAKKENIKTDENLFDVVFGFILSQAVYE